LNNLNDKGETPLAYGTMELLQKLDLSSGITISNNKHLTFNNNQLLKKKYREDLFDPGIKFQFERMKKAQNKVVRVSADGSRRVTSFLGSLDPKENTDFELVSSFKGSHPEEYVRGSKKKLTFHNMVD
jgi:hypothetical protein